MGTLFLPWYSGPSHREPFSAYRPSSVYPNQRQLVWLHPGTLICAWESTCWRPEIFSRSSSSGDASPIVSAPEASDLSTFEPAMANQTVVLDFPLRLN